VLRCRTKTMERKKERERLHRAQRLARRRQHSERASRPKTPGFIGVEPSITVQQEQWKPLSEMRGLQLCFISWGVNTIHVDTGGFAGFDTTDQNEHRARFREVIENL